MVKVLEGNPYGLRSLGFHLVERNLKDMVRSLKV